FGNCSGTICVCRSMQVCFMPDASDAKPRFYRRTFGTLRAPPTEEGIHGFDSTICARGARAARAGPADTYVFDLGAANPPLEHLAGQLGRRSREGYRWARQVHVPA